MKICCPGYFDLIHPGHERFLANLARDYESVSVVVLSGRSNRLGGLRLSPEQSRAAVQRALRRFANTSVSVVSPDDMLDWLQSQEDVCTLVVGDEATLQGFSWLQAVEKLLDSRGGGVRIYRESSTGSPSLDHRKSYKVPKSYDAEAVYQESLTGQGTTITALCEQMEARCRSSRVLVLGDLIVDEYIHCSVSGISAEAPIPVMTENDRSVFVGGAGVMARHLSALGCAVTFASSFGLGSISQAIEDQLEADAIERIHLSDAGAPLVKARYLAGSTKLFRVTRGDDFIPFEEERFSQLLDRLADFDLVFVADFGSLFRNEKLMTELLQQCRRQNLPVVADVQARYSGTSVLNAPNSFAVMPTEKEARLATDLHEAGLEELGRQLMERGMYDSLGLTLDQDGLVVFDREQKASVAYLPALNRDPIDVSGAGDCQLVYFAMSKFSGNPTIASAVIASIAAGVAVSNLGNQPVSLEEVRACWQEGAV